MRVAVLALVLACGKTEATEAPAKHEDRNEAPTAVARLKLDVKIAGTVSKWTDKEFDAVSKVVGKATDGDARDTWSLRELVHRNVGPTAHVVSVTGATTATIAPADWDDAAKVPIIHVTKRGALKFRWSDANGKWGETAVKDVTAIEVAN